MKELFTRHRGKLWIAQAGDRNDSRARQRRGRGEIETGGRVLDASLAGKWISPMHPEIVKDQLGNCDICGMPLVRAESLGYVTAEPTDAAKPLVVPASAALLTGTRAIVYVQIPDAETPTYEGREIVIGPRAWDYYLVKSGLKEGDLVVTNGNFKLDSTLQISAKPSMMTPQGGGGGGHNHGDMEVPVADDGVATGTHPRRCSSNSAVSLDRTSNSAAHWGQTARFTSYTVRWRSRVAAHHGFNPTMRFAIPTTAHRC